MTAIEQRAARPRGTRLRAVPDAISFWARPRKYSSPKDTLGGHGRHRRARRVSKPVLYQHFPGKLSSIWRCWTSTASHCSRPYGTALASTTDNKQRVAATMDAYFAYVEDEGGAFRLVFESDLTNEPAVRERVERVSLQCAEAISDVIAEDTACPRTSPCCWPSGWAGCPRWSPGTGCPAIGIPRDKAVQLLTSLAWRGIAGFPLHAGEAERGH